MADNTTPRTPEEMGARLDQEIKDEVHDWASKPEGEDYENLDERIDQRLRKTIAGWVGATADASWKEIGMVMDANTRHSIGKWVGAPDDADWGTISNRIENRVRYNVAKLVRARKAEDEAADAQWSDIAAKVESDVRGVLARVIGTPQKEASWKDIGDELVHKMRDTFEKVREAVKSEAATPTEERPKAVRIDIEAEETGSEATPGVTSEKPVEPQS